MYTLVSKMKWSTMCSVVSKMISYVYSRQWNEFICVQCSVKWSPMCTVVSEIFCSNDKLTMVIILYVKNSAMGTRISRVIEWLITTFECHRLEVINNHQKIFSMKNVSGCNFKLVRCCKVNIHRLIKMMLKSYAFRSIILFWLTWKHVKNN